MSLQRLFRGPPRTSAEDGQRGRKERGALSLVRRTASCSGGVSYAGPAHEWLQPWQIRAAPLGRRIVVALESGLAFEMKPPGTCCALVKVPTAIGFAAASVAPPSIQAGFVPH
eukprot:1971481-Rhodomonas_salina.1